MTTIIKGTMIWQEIEMGFYGIKASDGRELLPLNLPPHLEKNGMPVHLKIEEIPDAMTAVMWGTPVKIIEVY